MTQRFTFSDLPAGQSYQRLLDLAAKWCTTGQVIVRPELRLSRRGNDLVSALRPHILDELQVAEWPGTILFNQQARAIRFSIVPESVNLLRSAESLSAWQQPRLPEDLAFFRGDGRLWLGSVVHEKDAFMDLEMSEIGQLHEDIQRLLAI